MKKFIGIVFLVLIMSACCSNKCDAQIPQDAILYYPFNGNANDESFAGNHDGDVHGATLDMDRFGNPNCAFLFDDKDQILVNNPEGIELSKDFTISIWLNFSEFNQYTDIIFKKLRSGSEERSKGIKIVDNSPCFGMWKAYFPNIGPTFENMIWHHVVFIYDDGKNSIYFWVDGNKYVYGTNAIELLPDSPSHDLIIGGENVTPYYTNGIIDDIRIYSRVLDSLEVSELYNETETTDIDSNNDLSVKIYPNPATYYINIEKYGENVIFVYDIEGKKLIETKFVDNFKIDVSKFSTGMYFYKIGNIKGKFLKN